MRIFKVERPNDEWGYDEYDAFVVVAESEDEARSTHPSDGPVADCDGYSRMNWPVDLSTLVVTDLGEAAPGIAAGVVLASFNAG